MRYTDAEILALTPRKFVAQLNAHIHIQKQMNGEGASNKNPSAPMAAGYIDQLKGW